jgi:hypothetical protein
MPFLVLVTALAAGNGRWVPGAGTAARGLLLFGLVLLYTYVVARSTEFHTDRLRRWLEVRLGLAPGSA